MLVSNIETAIVVAAIFFASSHVIVKALDVFDTYLMRKAQDASSYISVHVSHLNDRLSDLETKIENTLGVGSNPKA